MVPSDHTNRNVQTGSEELMPPFERPAPFDYSVADEIKAVRDYRDTKPGRSIPRKSAGNVLVASWNIANLGDRGQPRDTADYRLIAEMLSWFDVIAVQEVKEELEGLRGVQLFLPSSYKAIFTDKGGNEERLVYLYDSDKVERLELAGEVAVPPKDHRHIKLPGITAKFKGFDRNPYAVAFRSGGFRFTLVNAHLFFGSESTKHENRRALETYALGRWADLTGRSADAYTSDVIVLGDLNMPKAEPDDKIFKALTKRGLHVPEHSTKIGSTLANDKHYDQIAFFPGRTSQEFVTSGVFDFDGALFSDLFTSVDRTAFNAFMRYHISDHRILWSQFRC